MDIQQYIDEIKPLLDESNLKKAEKIKSPQAHRFIARSASLCRPEKIFICGDSPEDIEHVRKQAIISGEEIPLATPGHTCHFDGMRDQGRDREATKYLVPEGDYLSKTLGQMEREKGLSEIEGLLRETMPGRTMIVRLLSLGPRDSVFSIPCIQCTDSWYVAHSEDLLYRSAFGMFTKETEETELFKVLHSAGRMDENMVSVDSDKKRIYIDYNDDTIYSVNTQYAGNTVGLKKLALRLTIRKADREGWLAEHMLLMGVHGPDGEKSYLAGAFPSACGKTATAMLPGETILGDDIAYLRNINGEARAANAESGIFGIIQDITRDESPTIHRVLTSPGEVIFSNVLVNDGKPYWLGMDTEIPEEGVNFSGRWHKGKTDEDGNEIPHAHKNARYAVRLGDLENVDPALDEKEGVRLSGIMYGGRDAKSYVPVQQGFDWDHGIVAYGASLETETTFATTGADGVPEINLMSIQDFVSIPLGRYIKNNLEFGKQFPEPPLVFGVNYFLRDEKGDFLNEIKDKHVWIKWMEMRIHGRAGAVKSPTGLIPEYKDLRELFKQVLDKEYQKEDYIKQFTIRVPENMEKIDRIETFHRANVTDAPEEIFKVLRLQKKNLIEARERHGDYISPENL